MPDDAKETTLAGTKYRMKLLGGEHATRAACIITGPALRAIDAVVAKVDLSKGLDALGWKDLTSLPAVAAALFDAVGYEGVTILTRLFAEHTTVFVPSGAPGDVSLYPVPLTNRLDTHFVGKWPVHLAWLGWGVAANGFLDVSSLAAELRQAAASAKDLLRSPPGSTGSSGASS